VNIGGRQERRLHAENVIHAGYDSDDIGRAIAAQLTHGRYASSSIYSRPDTSQAMVDILASAELYVQKRFHEGQA